MLNTKQRRLAFFICSSMPFLMVGILIAYNGVSSPWPWMCIPLFILVPMLYMKLVQLPYIMWKESYRVGVAEIDYDHKILLELINRVVLASTYKFGNDYSKEIFDKLIDYTKYHFDREEKLMEKYGFPDRERHMLQHSKFIDKINDFYSKFDNSSNIKHHEIFDFLKTWLLKHIGKSDKELGAYIQAKSANTSEKYLGSEPYKNSANIYS